VTQHRVNQRGDGPGVGAKPEGGEGVAASSWRDWIDPRRAGWLRLLLLAVPVAIAMRFAGMPAVWRFVVAGIAVIPLAGLMGEATEHLSRRLGPGIGGLLNATFGNAAELIIALFALFKGLDGVVKASLTGSIIGNLLLVLGASLFAGGLKYPVQRFNRTAAGVGGTMMVLAAIGMLIPAIFHALPSVSHAGLEIEHELSVSVCAVLMIAYVLSLVFSLVTHKDLYNPDAEEVHGDGEGDAWSAARAATVLMVATLFVAWISEILVGAVEASSRTLGLTEVFVGVIVVATVGNAAEHSTAVLMAMRNKMDLAVGIAMGSALQIALFVAPVLVFASYLRPHPMDLLFTTLEIVAVLLAVIIARMVAEDGESNWLEGTMLLMIYAILGLAFFFLPETGPKDAGATGRGVEVRAAAEAK
jgi:Ca2+:H+ antiporter